MKLFLLSLAMMIMTAALGQKDSLVPGIFLNESDRWFISGGFDAAIYFYQTDSTIIIEGDTMKAIRSAVLSMMRQQKEDQKNVTDLWQFIQAAVDFSNHVPDHWRDKAYNCKWAAFERQLHKFGYRQQPIGKGAPPRCD